MDKQKHINKRQSQISRLFEHRQGLIIVAELATHFVAHRWPNIFLMVPAKFLDSIQTNQILRICIRRWNCLNYKLIWL